MSAIDILGYVAGVIMIISLLPQNIKSWKTKSAYDISLLTFIIYVVGLILWIIYAIIIKSNPLAIMTTVELVLAISIVCLIIKYGIKKSSETDKKMGAGFGVMVLKDGKVLLGRRHDDPEKADSLMHGEGTWTMPGGKLHFGEDLKEAAIREALEETSIKIKKEDLKLISLTNDIVSDAHFITVGFLCEKFEGEPKVMEPDEIVEWQWFSLDKLPAKIFFPSEKILKNYLAKEVYKF